MKTSTSNKPQFTYISTHVFIFISKINYPKAFREYILIFCTYFNYYIHLLCLFFYFWLLVMDKLRNWITRVSLISKIPNILNSNICEFGLKKYSAYLSVLINNEQNNLFFNHIDLEKKKNDTHWNNRNPYKRSNRVLRFGRIVKLLISGIDMVIRHWKTRRALSNDGNTV